MNSRSLHEDQQALEQQAFTQARLVFDLYLRARISPVFCVLIVVATLL